MLRLPLDTFSVISTFLHDEDRLNLALLNRSTLTSIRTIMPCRIDMLYKSCTMNFIQCIPRIMREVEVGDEEFKKALHLCSIRGHIKMVRHLMSYRQREPDELLPSHASLEEVVYKIIERYPRYEQDISLEILDEVKMNRLEIRSSIPRLLISSCDYGHHELFKYLYTTYGSIHESYCLRSACRQDNHEIVSLLLENGVQPDSHIMRDALEYDSSNSFRALLKVSSSRDINIKYMLSSTLLANSDILTRVIEEDEGRFDPLLYKNMLLECCRKGYPDCISLLLSKVEDVNLLLEIACKNGSVDVVEELLKDERVYPDSNSIKIVCRRLSMNIMRLFLKHKKIDVRECMKITSNLTLRSRRRDELLELIKNKY